MRITATSLTAAFLYCSLISTTSAEVLDFSGWNHSQVSSSAGQTFDNISGDLDVTVNSVGAFDSDSTFEITMSGGVAAIRAEHTSAKSNSFVFHFSRPVDVYIEFTRLDTAELLGIYGIGPESFLHLGGLEPTTTPDGSGIKLQGAGIGASAADGRVFSGPTSVLTVTYQSTVDGLPKYLDFNVGTVVPEPSTFSMFGIALIGLLQLVRRRN